MKLFKKSIRLALSLGGMALGLVASFMGSASAQDDNRVTIPLPYSLEGDAVTTDALVSYQGHRYGVAWPKIRNERPYAATKQLYTLINAMDQNDLPALRKIAHPDALADAGGDAEVLYRSYLSTWDQVELVDVVGSFIVDDRIIFVVRARFGENTVLPTITFQRNQMGEWKFVTQGTEFRTQIIRGWTTRGAISLTGGASVDSLYADDTDRAYEVPLITVAGNPVNSLTPQFLFNGEDPRADDVQSDFEAFVAAAKAALEEGSVDEFINFYDERSAVKLRTALSASEETAELLADFQNFELMFVLDAAPVYVGFFRAPGDSLQTIFARREGDSFKFINVADTYSVLNTFVSPNMLQGIATDPAFSAFAAQ